MQKPGTTPFPSDGLFNEADILRKDVADRIKSAIFDMFRGDSQEPVLFDKSIYVFEEFTRI